MQSHVFHVLGFFATLGAAIAAFPKIWQAIKWMFALLRRLDDLSRLAPVIVGMAQQFQRNGGSSMKDAIEGVRQDVSDVKDDVAAVKGDVAALKEQTNAQDTVLQQLQEDVAALKQRKN